MMLVLLTVARALVSLQSGLLSYLAPPPSSELDDDASSSPYAFCQCEDEDTLLECSACGSFFDLDTHCPGC
jgi:hypothetical protein